MMGSTVALDQGVTRGQQKKGGMEQQSQVDLEECQQLPVQVQNKEWLYEQRMPGHIFTRHLMLLHEHC